MGIAVPAEALHTYVCSAPRGLEGIETKYMYMLCGVVIDIIIIFVAYDPEMTSRLQCINYYAKINY